LISLIRLLANKILYLFALFSEIKSIQRFTKIVFISPVFFTVDLAISLLLVVAETFTSTNWYSILYCPSRLYNIAYLNKDFQILEIGVSLRLLTKLASMFLLERCSLCFDNICLLFSWRSRVPGTHWYRFLLLRQIKNWQNRALSFFSCFFIRKVFHDTLYLYEINNTKKEEEEILGLIDLLQWWSLMFRFYSFFG